MGQLVEGNDVDAAGGRDVVRRDLVVAEMECDVTGVVTGGVEEESTGWDVGVVRVGLTGCVKPAPGGVGRGFAGGAPAVGFGDEGQAPPLPVAVAQQGLLPSGGDRMLAGAGVGAFEVSEDVLIQITKDS
ncbi:hypothetical protein [Streptomyces triticirhizae]|uniref:hypothetical protein n=1 Tax=Streptomyces triticirhizae TaxID=2483353 RepID=UPI00389A661E